MQRVKNAHFTSQYGWCGDYGIGRLGSAKKIFADSKQTLENFDELLVKYGENQYKVNELRKLVRSYGGWLEGGEK